MDGNLVKTERNGDITTFSVTTDKVSDICISWKTACLIMWRHLEFRYGGHRPMMTISTCGKHFPRYKESVFSFQSATGSEIQSNVKHMAAILEINMAATRGREFLGSIFLNDLYVL